MTEWLSSLEGSEGIPDNIVKQIESGLEDLVSLGENRVVFYSNP